MQSQVVRRKQQQGGYRPDLEEGGSKWLLWRRHREEVLSRDNDRKVPSKIILVYLGTIQRERMIETIYVRRTYVFIWLNDFIIKGYAWVGSILFSHTNCLPGSALADPCFRP